MGERIYLPQLGRFLSTDPVPGGSANSYDYGDQDPLNLFDLHGTMVVNPPSGAESPKAAARMSSRTSMGPAGETGTTPSFESS
jgi:hypothetical protein